MYIYSHIYVYTYIYIHIDVNSRWKLGIYKKERCVSFTQKSKGPKYPNAARVS